MGQTAPSQEPNCSLCNSSGLRLYFEKGRYKFYTCPQCGHCRVFPYPSPEETKAHYEQGFTESYLAQNAAWFEVLAKKRLQIVENYFGPGFRGSILDVGSGYGFFLREAKNAGWTVLGIESSPAEVDYSTKHLCLDVLNDDIQTAMSTLADSSFDVISFFHVLEHLEEPGQAILEARRVLKPGGLLILNSPNLDSAVFRILGSRWSWIYVPGHLQYFRVIPLSRWLQRNQLTLHLMETWTDAPNIYFMLEEAVLLTLADLFEWMVLPQKFGRRIKGFVYGPFHQQVVQDRLRKLYRLTPYLDRYIKSRSLGHEFLLLVSK